ncbi:hypothetical protein [Bdellovibrio sp. HCB337]|uniref:hypothetical protein n=1 Tax=Bdellovibrio sp. HCB337 TaxID=3394358 RepID=UPI0039A76039
MDYAASYLKRQEHSLDKWYVFMNENLRQNFQELTYEEGLTPFFGAEDWNDWTPDQRKKLFQRFCQFNAEALMAFEQCFMYASVQPATLIQDETERKAFFHFVREEFLHTKAFRCYLRAEKAFNFPQDSVFIHRCHRLKNNFAWILKREPFAIIIPGAKSEAYSLFYSKLLERVYKTKTNSFTELNTLHSKDEVFHVQFDYNFVDSLVKNWSLWRQWRFIFYSFLMILNIQFIVILGFMNILKEVAPEKGFFKRTYTMMRFFRWTLWHFVPYQQTRTNLQATYKQRKHFMYLLFRLGSL